jgi:hypothetical protein
MSWDEFSDANKDADGWCVAERMLAGVTTETAGDPSCRAPERSPLAIVSGKQCPCASDDRGEGLIYSPVNNALSIQRVRLGK